MPKTKRPVSTISYNTEGGLVAALNEVRAPFWFYIEHEPETLYVQQPEKKKHFHVYLDFCGGQVELLTLPSYFDEPDPDHEKPRSCIPFWPSKFEDACLYDLHDKAYLTHKNLVRQYHYKLADIKTNDQEFFDNLVNQIDYTKYLRSDYLAIMERAYSHGARHFGQLVTFYRPPIQAYSAWQKCWADYVAYREQLERDPRLRKNCAWQEFAYYPGGMRLSSDMKI